MATKINTAGKSPVKIAVKTVDSDNSSENGFNFKGVDSQGEPLKMYVQATSKRAAAQDLAVAGIQVENLSPRRAGRKRRAKLPTSTDLATFAEQFGDQIEVGESPASICRTLSLTQTNPLLSEALLGAEQMIRNGRSLSEAFRLQRDSKGRQIFPVTLVCAFRIGEQLGSTTDTETGKSESAFVTMLRRFSEGEKKADELRSQIRSAMMYPVGVFIFSLFAVFAVMYFVMPKMVEIYQSLLTGKNAELPFLTQILVTGSNFLTSSWGGAAIFASVVASVFVLKWAKSPSGSDWLKGQVLYLPVFGSFYRDLYAAQTVRTLSMLAGGVPSMYDRFEIAADIATNPVYKKMLVHVRNRYMDESLELYKLFLPYAFLMGDQFRGVLRSFDTTGNMQGSFHNYAKVLEVRAERRLAGVLDMLKNFAIVPVGVIVAIIVAGLYSPLFSLAGRIASK